MAATITICDELIPGNVYSSFTIDLPSMTITARELIELRVEREVRVHNQSPTQRFEGLVQPDEARRNGRRVAEPIDWRKQASVAIEAFQRNGFLLLVGERQITDLDEEIELEKESTATFIRLVPLMGG